MQGMIIEDDKAGAAAPSAAAVDASIAAASSAVLDYRKPDGHWVFELEADATIPAEYVLLRHYLAEPIDAVILRDLKPDSLDVITVSMAIEDEFGVYLDEPEIMALGEKATLRDLLALVEGKLAKETAA